jgi:flavin reductase (DIM6/NTAB) family NADH-FMN oxidoreductase RutF
MPSRYRAKFINSLSGFKSANLIGTQDNEGHTNLAIFSSIVHLGASPALVGFVMRPDNNSRHTLDNIISTKHYTINQVSTQFYQGAHQSSARYPKTESEFLHSELSTSYVEGINAPFVKESRLKYAVTLKEIMPIPLNGTQFIIGEITHIICEENVIQPDGYIDIEALETVCISGLDSYHQSKRLSRLSYAKTEASTVGIALDGSALITSESDS